MTRSKLILTPSGFKTWKLVQDFKVKVNKQTIIVPKGKITDLASTPKILWSILPPFGRYTQASVVHDYLYGVKTLSRAETDKIFYDLMLRYKTHKWKAKLMYYAVRCFGWLAWRDKNGK